MLNHRFRAPSVVDFGNYKWMRQHDLKLDELKHTLKHLCPAWNQGCIDDQTDEFHQDIAIYVLDDEVTNFLKEATRSGITNVATELAFGWDSFDWQRNMNFRPGHAMRLVCSKNPFSYISQWKSSNTIMKRLCNDAPLQIMVPFLIRLLLQDPILVRQLTDVNSGPSPEAFLIALQSIRIFDSNPLLWDIDLRKLLLNNLWVLTLPPEQFWDLTASPQLDEVMSSEDSSRDSYSQEDSSAN
eukprot:Gregarina_sp_Poly_1__5503@NODE_2903_length_1562_cov_90_618060_g1817_i2_p1_GENE_NODE_2903_length_1562_cov_90_618060_g1817_i2NODE_2903_length_1562_cov_90_618060_g1817_i2_p1_ORF_typecomplete_len241_score35_98Phage_TAC_6/PF09550_10/0_34_NODE_2903_length_1562_cov_90_618060_g1817_i224746